MRHTVICQDWLESESGWGQRPDGVSLHLTMEDCTKYREEYWKRQLASHPPGHVPHEYSRECGEPYKKRVNDETFKEIVAAKPRFGIRRF